MIKDKKSVNNYSYSKMNGELTMAKKKLIWYPGAMYHVTSRGNRKSDIFKDEQDYLIYLEVVKEALEYYKNSYEVIAYTLMTNHVHLQIKTKDIHIWYLMSRINKNYARNFNNKYNFVGHVFQSRYNGELIDSDKYVLQASRYIHLNPVRANLVATPKNYKWSSYSVYIGKRKESIVNSEILLSYFIGDRRELYRRYVEGENSNDKLQIIPVKL